MFVDHLVLCITHRKQDRSSLGHDHRNLSGDLKTVATEEHKTKRAEVREARKAGREYCPRLVQRQRPTLFEDILAAAVERLATSGSATGTKTGTNGTGERRQALEVPGKFGAPGGIRTPDPRLRRPMLYPTELQARQVVTIHHAGSRLHRGSYTLVPPREPVRRGAVRDPGGAAPRDGGGRPALPRSSDHRVGRIGSARSTMGGMSTTTYPRPLRHSSAFWPLYASA